MEAPASARETVSLAFSFPEVRRLACFDIFSGCGGFSEGLKQSGLVTCRWAVEQDKAAAKAFKKNNPEATVFQEDCREVLKKAKKGEPFQNDPSQLMTLNTLYVICANI